MCCPRASPCVLTLVALLSFLMGGLHVNYYVSYGPLNLTQEKAYVLAFGGNIAAIVACFTCLGVLNSTKRDFFKAFICYTGLVVAATLTLIAAIMFYQNPPTINSMKIYVLHTFLTTKQNTRILERLQKHSYREKGALKCCGVESYLDYTAVNHDYKNLSVPEVHVPDSCCVRMKKGCGRYLQYPRPSPINDTSIYHKGCLVGGIDNFVNRQDYLTYGLYYKIPYAFGALFLAVILAMVSFYCLYDEEERLGLVGLPSVQSLGPADLEYVGPLHGSGEFVSSRSGFAGSTDRLAMSGSGSVEDIIVQAKVHAHPFSKNQQT